MRASQGTQFSLSLYLLPTLQVSRWPHHPPVHPCCYNQPGKGAQPLKASESPSGETSGRPGLHSWITKSKRDFAVILDRASRLSPSVLGVLAKPIHSNGPNSTAWQRACSYIRVVIRSTPARTKSTPVAGPHQRNSIATDDTIRCSIGSCTGAIQTVCVCVQSAF